MSTNMPSLDNNLDKIVGANMKRLRREKKLSRVAMAMKIHCSVETIASWETSCKKMSNMLEYARILNKDILDFFSA